MAYWTGSSVTSSSTQASQPESSSHVRGVSIASPPGSVTQLQRTVAKPPSLQTTRRTGHDLAREHVAPEPAVAVRELADRRDDERRIRDDEPEPFVAGGLEQVPLPPLDVLDAVQLGVEPGEPERARVQIETDDALAVARGEERLNAGAGAEVEGSLDRPPHRERGDHARRRPDVEHVIRRACATPDGRTR